MGRGALRVRVTADGRDVDLITAHLKSKLLTFPGERFEPRDEDERARFAGYALYRRASEAVTLRAYANGLLEGEGRERAVMFSATSTTSRAQPPPRSCWARRDRKSVRLASIATTRATAGGSGTSRRGSAQRRFSRRFRGRGELIDHLLVSHRLVHHVEEAATGPGRARSITEVPTSRRDDPASDHLPVWARFDLG
jgi:hypothetical protein